MSKYSFDWSIVSGGAPYITISALGIAFNSVSITKLGNPDKIIIGFDEKNLVIGIKAYTDEKNIKPYDFLSRVRNGWIRIGCRDFVKYLQKVSQKDYSVAKKYIAQYDEDEETLLVQILDETENDTEQD